MTEPSNTENIGNTVLSHETNSGRRRSSIAHLKSRKTKIAVGPEEESNDRTETTNLSLSFNFLQHEDQIIEETDRSVILECLDGMTPQEHSVTVYLGLVGMEVSEHIMQHILPKPLYTHYPSAIKYLKEHGIIIESNNPTEKIYYFANPRFQQVLMQIPSVE